VVAAIEEGRLKISPNLHSSNEHYTYLPTTTTTTTAAKITTKHQHSRLICFGCILLQIAPVC
jgi:hypothetical protein